MLNAAQVLQIVVVGGAIHRSGPYCGTVARNASIFGGSAQNHNRQGFRADIGEISNTTRSNIIDYSEYPCQLRSSDSETTLSRRLTCGLKFEGSHLFV